MKTKLEMAHEYALEMLKRGDPEYRIVTDAWNLADAMYIENTERKSNVSQELSQEEWQPDWSKAPEWAKWWAMDADRSCYWFSNKPTMESVTWWAITYSIADLAPSFDYDGNWKDSLRERP